MISVSSSDARNELGLGFGGGLEEEIMEESDMEEESTHSFVSCVDPDVALSYIDEKLENVLGHFQKDFEGGVSAENLGPKFGGYGSFLSMYQRSPACSLPKSPPEVQNQVGVRSNCSASSLLPESSISGSTSKALASKFVKSSTIGTTESKQKSVTKISSSAPSNHRTLRLRIKVGSSDLSSLKNVSSYNKQGLNMPPSTSRVNCHLEVEEGLLYGICDSPTKILMAMVSFPLHKDQLLSPLSEDLIQLGQKEKITKEAGDGSVNKSDSKNTHDMLRVSDGQKCTGKVSNGKKEKLKERVKYLPPSNSLDGNHVVSNTEIEADTQSCEDLVSKTMKLPLLSCLSPSYIHPTKEIDKVSDSHQEGTLRGTNKTDLDAALVDSKSELEDNVVQFPDRSVKETETVNTRKALSLTEVEKSSGSKPKREKTPSIEPVDYSSVVKVSQSETRNEEKILKPRLPKEQNSIKSSSSIVSMNSLRGKDADVNVINKNVPDKLQEDIEGSEDVYKGFFGDPGELKEEKQRSPILKAQKEKLSEENAFNKSFSSVKNDEEARNNLHLVCEPDSKHLIKSRDLNEERHNTKQSGRWEMKNNNSVEGVQNLGVESERELSGTSKKTKTGKSRFSAVDRPRSNKILDDVAYNKTMVIQASAEEVKDISRASSHDRHDDRKRKLKENKESGDSMRLREAAVTDSSGEHVRKKMRLKDSSCDGKELPFNSETCDRDRGVRQENSKDSASHQPFTAIVENCTESGSQRKNKEEGSSASSKDNNRGTVNDVQDLGTAAELKIKESRSKKRPARKVSEESSKEESREDINGSHFSSQKPDRAKRFCGKSNNYLEVTADQIKNKLAPPAATDQVELLGHGSEISNTMKQIMRNDRHSVTHHGGSRNQKQNGTKKTDHVGLSPLKKESTSQVVSNSIKEATDLKHMADRLKNAGSGHESTGVYFQAALKFLHGASLLESSSTEHAAQKNTARSRQIYGSTAKLCEFCAHEYEKNKDMGAAALAYKCMEVAYLRITYSSHSNISRCRYELQAALQLTPSVESPSFASDGENSNHILAGEKVPLSNIARSSPKVTGNQVLSSVNNSSLSQLLAFSENVTIAMDASRRAQIAFTAAKEKSYSNEGITSIKRALDFSFQDMEKLLHVVRLAMESINR